MAVEDCKTCDGTGYEYVNTVIGGEKVACSDCGGRGY